MTNLKISRSAVLVLALTLCSAGNGWAALTSCGTAPGTTLATLSAASGENPAGGCGQTDLGFNTFSVGTSSGTIAGPTTSQISISTSGGTIGGGGTTITPIVALYTLTGGNSISTGGGTIIDSFNATGAPVSGVSPPSPAPDVWGVNGLSLTFAVTSSATPSNAETVEVKEAFCTGQVTFTCLTTANNYGYLQITEDLATNGIDSYTDALCTPGSGGCKTSSATTASLSISLASSIALGTQTTIDINRPNGSGNTLTLGSISETFDQVESPEPPSFILLGSAFAAFGIFGLRKRRQAYCAAAAGKNERP